MVRALLVITISTVRAATAAALAFFLAADNPHNNQNNRQ
jgi:hypothetical protein